MTLTAVRLECINSSPNSSSGGEGCFKLNSARDTLHEQGERGVFQANQWEGGVSSKSMGRRCLKLNSARDTLHEQGVRGCFKQINGRGCFKQTYPPLLQVFLYPQTTQVTHLVASVISKSHSDFLELFDRMSWWCPTPPRVRINNSAATVSGAPDTILRRHSY